MLRPDEGLGIFRIKIRRSPLQEKTLSHGLWAVTAPAPPATGKLKGEIKADVAIIGGGFTGLSAALHLAEAGSAAVLLEARQIGFGGAGRNVGLVNAGLWLMPEEVEKKVGPAYGARLVDILGHSPDLVFELIEKHNIPCEAIRKGTLHCAHSPGGYRGLQQRESQWKARGAPVRLLDRQRAAAEIGSESFYGALLDERAGTVQPLAYAYGLATAAQQAGASLYTESPVIDYSREGNAWRLATPEGTLIARSVILAVQGYPDFAFGDHRQAIIPFNFFQFATPPLPEEVRKTILPGGQGAWDTHLILSSYRLDQAGRLIVGSVGQVENGGYRLHANWALRTIGKVFPQIGETQLEYAWNGCIAMTVDHIPRFHILADDMVTVTSYNGRGIGPGTVFGKLLAGYVLGGAVQDIPLPVTRHEGIFLRGLRGLFYEAGARAFHLLQRRGL
jgi:glycine/D-amino acid oxidase-like deaminating enzyme